MGPGGYPPPPGFEPQPKGKGFWFDPGPGLNQGLLRPVKAGCACTIL